MKLLSIILIAFLLLPIVQAGSISIVNSVKTTASPGEISTEITIKNTGISTAKNIFLNLSVEDQWLSTVIVPKLASGESKVFYASFHNLSKTPGKYPLIIRTNYQDSNLYKFQSVSLSYYSIGQSSESDIKLSMKNQDIVDHANVGITLINNLPKKRNIKVSIIVPYGLKIDSDNFQLILQPRQQKTISIPIEVEAALAGSTYVIYALVEYEDQMHYLDISQAIISVKAPRLFNGIIWYISGLFVIFLIIFILSQYTNKLKPKKYIIDIAIGIIILLTLMHYFPPSIMTSVTTTTGGDTASHYYSAYYLKDTLIKDFRLFGWTPGNYAGFPLLQFYFPFPFLMMVLLSYMMPLQVAFKIISVSGIFLLPLTAYLAGRLLKLKFPAPILMASASLLFLFNETNSMWGANILSTLAGEFAYSISTTLAIIFLASLYKGIQENKNWKINALLLFFVGFSHVYGLLFVSVSSLFFVLQPKKFTKNLLYLIKVFASAGLLLSFWILPLIANLPYTTAYADRWFINSIFKVIPPILLPSLGIILIAIGYQFYKKQNDLRLLFGLFCIFAAMILYVFALPLGVVDIRFLPYMQLFIAIISGAIIAYIPIKNKRFFPILITAIVLFVIVFTSVKVAPWAAWNYQGFEEKNTWTEFEKINYYVKGDFNDPRVVYEHNNIHNSFGSSRAFESLPLFSGRQTLEGLYMQSSLSAPFVFYIQSQVSKVTSCPFPNYGCSKTNLSSARKRLQLYNVDTLLVVTDYLKDMLKNQSGYQLKTSIGDYQIYQVTGSKGYVYVPQIEPVTLKTDYPNQDAYRIFIDDNTVDIPVILANNPDPPYIEQIPLTAAPMVNNCSVQTQIDKLSLSFNTTCPGYPHIISVSYFPAWKSQTGEKIYRVSPSFMLIYPKSNHITLKYQRTSIEILGILLSLVMAVVLFLPLRFNPKISFDQYHWKILFGVLILILFVFAMNQTVLYDHTMDQKITDIAIQTQQYTTCEFAGKNIDQCYIQVAKITDDLNLCHARVSKKNKRQCIDEFNKK